MLKKNFARFLIVFLSVLFINIKSFAQSQYELNTGWKCQKASSVNESGTQISNAGFSTASWEEATVPGTILTTQLNNGQIPDPFYGMNNNLIPDIYKTGRDYYTYWFVKEFKIMPAQGNNQVYLNFRGVNYSCNIFLNGHKLNARLHSGMFLRQSYNITKWLTKNAHNGRVVIVCPR